MEISVCVATYRRPAQLAAMLADVAQQTRPPCEVVVVDNDQSGSARATVEQARDAHPCYPIRYDIQPLQNIALTRNRTIALAQGPWLAFIDDDERAPADWLERLGAAAQRFEADGVLAPVEPVLPSTAPDWLRRGRFYEWPHLKTGEIVPLRLLRFGNVLLRAKLVQTDPPAFDPAYGLTGGEDGDLLTRLAQEGWRLVWCDEAAVTEPVHASRLTLRWLLLRSMRGGQAFARHVLAGRHGRATITRRAVLLGRAFVQMIIAIVLALGSVPIGFHHSARWLLKASANLGKLSALVGIHYREYAKAAS